MAYISRAACLVGCALLLASLLFAVPRASDNAVAGTTSSMQDESALIQKELSVTIRTPEDEHPEWETDENGVMKMPDVAKVKFTPLPEKPEDLAPGEKLPAGQSFGENMRKNDEMEMKLAKAREGDAKEEYEKFVKEPNRPGHVHFAPGTLFIPEKDSAKMQQAVVKASELVKKAKQVKKSVVSGLEKAEEMVMVSMPSLDEVSEQIVEEDKTGKYYELGGEASTGRRRRVSLDEALPEWAKKKAAELPEKVLERRKKNEEQTAKAQKIWNLQSTVGTQAAVQEIQLQAKDNADKRVTSIGEVISKWTTTTKAPDDQAASSIDDSDDSEKSSSSIRSLATTFGLLVFLKVVHSAS